MAPINSSKQQFLRTTGGTDAVWVHHDPYSARPRFSPLESDIRTDVCVIGAGIAGISTAFELVSRGHDVVLVDGRDVVSGETGRTSGHLSNALDDHYTAIKQKHGADGARAAADSHTWALQRVGEIAEQLKIDCEYRRVPAYEISQYPRDDARHSDEVEQLRAEAQLASELGLPAEFRDGLTIRGWTGSPDQRDGIVFEKQAAFHPTRYLCGVLRWLAEQSNFRCHTGTRVLSVEEQSHSGGIIVGSQDGKDEPSVTISTEHGQTIGCNHAVEATCVPLQKLSVVAEMEYDRTYCIAIRVPRGSVEDCFIYDLADSYKYVRLTACDDKDDYMIVGGGDHPVGREGPAGRYEELEAWTRERFPQAGVVEYRWSGQVYEPVDYMAFIGRNQGCRRVYTVTGDSGNGLTHGVLAGRLIADLVDGNDRSASWEKLYNPSRLASVIKSASSMLTHAVQINTQYKRFLETDIQDVEDLAPGTGGVLNKGLLKGQKTPMAVYRDEDGSVTRMSAICPHMKGVVCWNAAEKTFDCPVHGSRFSATGLCLNGPAKANLEPADS